MFVWRALPGRADARPGAFLALPSLERHGIRAAFTNRTGGVSDGSYASLNLSFFSGDDPTAVRRNRARALAAVGASTDAWTSGRQVHGTRIEAVTGADRGRGAFDPATALQGVDGTWTDQPGVALAVLAADCVPVLLADAARRRIAVVHAGWRGMVGGVLANGVRALAEAGSHRESLAAFVGPAIGPCCYEVGDDVASAARASLGDDALVRHGDRTFMDLWSSARRALSAAGVREIWLAAICTRSEPHRFFSHRAGATARQGLVAVIA